MKKIKLKNSKRSWFLVPTTGLLSLLLSACQPPFGIDDGLIISDYKVVDNSAKSVLGKSHVSH